MAQTEYVLKVKGVHHLVFKTKHHDKQYLEKVAKELLLPEDSHFKEYEIHPSDASNAEMTEAEYLIHPVRD